MRNLERLRIGIANATEECVVWTRGKCSAGYGAMMYQGHMDLVHRVAWKLAHGTIPRGLFVLHKCDSRACYNPAHLFLGTAKDNTLDMVAKGRQGKNYWWQTGAPHPTAKVTPEQVAAIRKLRGSASHRNIGRLFGVSKDCVGDILRGETWSTIK